MDIVRGSALGLSGLLGAGVLAWPAAAPALAAEDVVYKREETATELVLVVDDDDDTNDRETRSRTGVSRATNDGTRSNFTRVSRDRDRGRSDKTRD